MRKTFKKFGKDLGCNILVNDDKYKRISLIIPTNFKKKHIMERSNIEKDPFKLLEEN